MHFQTLDELRKIEDLLKESDFEEAQIRWEPSTVTFELKTARPAGELKGGSLFRRVKAEWVPCRLLILCVKQVQLWEEYDVKPPLTRLLEVESQADGFRIRLASAHGLRVSLTVDRLDGFLLDEPGGR